MGLTGEPRNARDSSRSQSVIERNDDLLRALIDEIEDYAILLLDAAGNVATWNTGAQRFKGYRAEEIIGKHFSVFYPAEDAAAGKPQRLLAMATAAGRIQDEGWRVREDGSRFWANVVITALRDRDGALRGFGKITRDLTERRAAELELRSSEERFRLMVESIQDYAILMLDAQGNVATWNIGAERFKGYRAEEIIGRHFSTFYTTEDIAAGQPQRLLAKATAEGRIQDEGWRVRKDGTRFWANVVITALRDRDGALQGFAKITRDRSYEQELEQLADCDPLTGVLNRRSFGRELTGHVARIARYGATGSVLMIDLDNFKHFNDTHGHGAGDQLIVRIAHAMQARLRDSDVLARLGGDEFALLLPGGDDRATETIADALLAVVRDQDAESAGYQHRITASIGIARFDDAARSTPEEILVHADRAMYDSKKAGRNRWARYRPERQTCPDRMQWIERIDKAIADGGFALLAQPIFNLTNDETPKYELLLRMRDKSGELIPPSSFLNVAERLGRVGQIDRWVTLRAIEILVEQRALGRDLCIAVNLSGLTIGDSELLELIGRRLHETGLTPARLIFEVTESAAVAHVGRAVRFAECLAEIGCGFALDNFGAGSGSLSNLKQLRFDYLKIDGEFVQHCAENETDRVVISAMVQIARGLGRSTIAESVESQASLAILTSLGVDYAQGFHLARPAPLAQHLRALEAATS